MAGISKARSDYQLLERYRDALLGSAPLEPRIVDDVNRLFAANFEMVYAVCYRFVGDLDRASDLAQATMLRALERLHQYQGRSSFRCWLYTIARNICLRAVQRRGELLLDDGVIERRDPAANALKQLTRREREQVLRNAITVSLTPIEQEAVHLRYVDRLPVERITAILELETASGAGGLLQRCRRKLRRALKEQLKALGHSRSFVRTGE